MSHTKVSDAHLSSVLDSAAVENVIEYVLMSEQDSSSMQRGIKRSARAMKIQSKS